MRLKRKPPLRVRKAIACCSGNIGALVRSVHGLQEKVPEIEMLELFGPCERLRVNEFQLTARCQNQGGIGFRADANPIEAGRSRLRSVCLDRDLEIAAVQSVDERQIELEQRLAAGAHNVWLNFRKSSPIPALSIKG